MSTNIGSHNFEFYFCSLLTNMRVTEPSYPRLQAPSDGLFCANVASRLAPPKAGRERPSRQLRFKMNAR